MAQPAISYQQTVGGKVTDIPVTPTSPLPVTGGSGGSLATEATLAAAAASLANIDASTAAAAPYLPPRPLIKPANMGTTRGLITINSATTTTLLAAGGAGIIHRIHRMKISVDAADTLTIRQGTTALDVLRFTGANGVFYDFCEFPWFWTAANASFNIVSTTSANVDGFFDYVSEA